MIKLHRAEGDFILWYLCASLSATVPSALIVDIKTVVISAVSKDVTATSSRLLSNLWNIWNILCSIWHFKEVNNFQENKIYQVCTRLEFYWQSVSYSLTVSPARQPVHTSKQAAWLFAVWQACMCMCVCQREDGWPFKRQNDRIGVWACVCVCASLHVC